MFTRATNRTSGEQTYRKLCVYYWSLRASRLSVACAADPWKFAHISRGGEKNRNTLSRSTTRQPARSRWCTFTRPRRVSRASRMMYSGFREATLYPILAVTSRNSSLALIYCSGVDKIWTIYFASYSLFYIQFLHIFIPTNVGTLTLKERSDWDRLFYIFIRDNWFSRIASRQHKSAEKLFFQVKAFYIIFLLYAIQRVRFRVKSMLSLKRNGNSLAVSIFQALPPAYIYLLQEADNSQQMPGRVSIFIVVYMRTLFVTGSFDFA